MRIDREVEEKAATVLAAMGLTVFNAVRLLLTGVACEKALPFAPLVPNDETIAAMKEARAGNLPQCRKGRRGVQLGLSTISNWQSWNLLFRSRSMLRSFGR